MIKPWLVFFDLDGTLWDHLDVSSTRPPFTRVTDSIIADSKGDRLTLNRGALEFIDWVKSSGGIISTCSWNDPAYAMAALKTFSLENIFDYHRISTNPGKHISMIDLLNLLDGKGIHIEKGRIFYLDDRDIHMDAVSSSVQGLTFLHMWKEVHDFEDAKSIIKAKLELF